MTSEEKSELNEIRQAFDDAMLRADRAYSDMPNNELAHAIKAMVHVKKRLERLSAGNFRMTKRDVYEGDNGSWS